MPQKFYIDEVLEIYLNNDGFQYRVGVFI
jgi:hypothetical protein